MTKEIALIYYEKCEKIEGFDILLSDPYAGDALETIDSTVNLNLQQVWEFLCEGGDWNFKVTAHGRLDKVFMSGSIYHDNVLRHATDGQVDWHLCFATPAEMEELREKTRTRLRKEMQPLEKYPTDADIERLR